MIASYSCISVSATNADHYSAFGNNDIGISRVGSPAAPFIGHSGALPDPLRAVLLFAPSDVHRPTLIILMQQESRIFEVMVSEKTASSEDEKPETRINPLSGIMLKNQVSEVFRRHLV